MIYNLFPKFHVRHKGFSFHGPRNKDQGADPDLILIFADLRFKFSTILIIEFICLSQDQATQINHITVVFPVGQFLFDFVASV